MRGLPTSAHENAPQRSTRTHLPPTSTILREGFTAPFIPPLDPTWGGGNRVSPSYVALQSIFYTFNFLSFFYDPVSLIKIVFFHQSH